MIIFSTRARVLSPTLNEPLMTRDTVRLDTPAKRATSLMVEDFSIILIKTPKASRTSHYLLALLLRIGQKFWAIRR